MERFGKDLLLLERLAAGGMAEVYRAKRTGFGGFEKIVAVKRILQNYAENEEFKEMFRHEAILCAQLQHPNIVQVFSNGEHEDYLYLVMEYVNGKNVRQLLAKVDRMKDLIPIEIACHIVKEAARGLEFAHNFKDEATGQELNIVHRDMSPQNIMIGYDGTVKIVDFGIAKAAARSDSTKAGVLKGKFGYMSPEQAQGAKLDRRSDVFSLGIILWELLTQRRLFSTDDDMKTLQLVRDCNVMKPSRKNPRVPYALDKIVLKALAKNKSERYATAAELYRDLTRYLADRHPEFIDTDFATYMQKVFEDNIAKEREKRDKLALEAPAILAPKESERGRGAKADATQVDDHENTQVSLPEVNLREAIAGATQVQDAPEPADAPPKLSENIPLLGRDERTGPIEHELKELSQPGVLELKDLASQKDVPLAPVLEERLEPIRGVSDDLRSGASGFSGGESQLSLTNTNLKEIELQKSPVTSIPIRKMALSSKARVRRVALLSVAALLVLWGLSQKAPPSTGSADTSAKVAKEDGQQAAPDKGLPEATSSESAHGAPSDTVKTSPEEPNNLASQTDEGGAPSKSSPESEADLQPRAEPPQEVAGDTPEGDAKRGNLGDIKPLQRDPAGVLPGQIELYSLPRATAVFINDVKIIGDDGEPLSTPLKNIALDAGIYKIRLENSDLGARWEGEIKIKSERLFKKSVLLITPQQ